MHGVNNKTEVFPLSAAMIILSLFLKHLTCGDQIILVQHSQWHGRWRPGFLRGQDIGTHDIDYEEYLNSCLTRWRISTTCAMSAWRNYMNHRYIPIFPMKSVTL